MTEKHSTDTFFSSLFHLFMTLTFIFPPLIMAYVLPGILIIDQADESQYSDPSMSIWIILIYPDYTISLSPHLQ